MPQKIPHLPSFIFVLPEDVWYENVDIYGP